MDTCITKLEAQGPSVFFSPGFPGEIAVAMHYDGTLAKDKSCDRIIQMDRFREGTGGCYVATSASVLDSRTPAS